MHYLRSCGHRFLCQLHCTMVSSILCKLHVQEHCHCLLELAPQSLACHACYLAYNLRYLVAISDGL